MVDRRTVLKGLGLATATLAAPAIVRAQSKPTLTISWWGFNGDNLNKYLIEPFKQKFGANVAFDLGPIPDRFNRLRARPGSVDVIYLSDIYVQPGADAGLFTPLDRSKIPNIADIYPLARAPQGEALGPAYTVQKYSIIYDPTKVSAPLTSWADLWRSDLKGRIALPSIATSAGRATVEIAGKKVGIDAYTDPAGAFESLKELRPNVLKIFNSGSELVNLFAQGEIVAAAAQDFTFGSLKEAIPGVVWIEPTEGAYINLATINLTKGSQNAELASEYVNMHLDAQIQTNLAIAKVDAPVNQKVQLTKEQQGAWAFGASEVASMHTLDYSRIQAVTPDWLDRWNELFGQ